MMCYLRDAARAAAAEKERKQGMRDVCAAEKERKQGI